MPLLPALLLFAALPIPTALLPEQPAGDPPIVEGGGGGLPHLASDGTNFLLTSTAASFYPGESTTYLMLVWPSPLSDLWSLRVGNDGTVLDYPPTHIAALNGHLTSVATGPAGQLLLAYTRSDTLWTGQRLSTRFIVPARPRAAAHR